MNHNDFLFRKDAEGFKFLRRFDDMYKNCEDPHGQASEINRLDYQLVLALCQRFAGPDVLDVGCGLGYFTRELQNALPRSAVHGCDISPAALSRARRLAPDCEFFPLDLKAPMSIDSRFDLIVAMHVLYYFTDDEIGGVIDNLHGMLADGGYLLVGYNLPEEMSFGRYIRCLADAKTIFEAHGFSMRFSMDVVDSMGTTYAGAAIGRGLYFVVQNVCE